MKMIRSKAEASKANQGGWSVPDGCSIPCQLVLSPSTAPSGRPIPSSPGSFHHQHQPRLLLHRKAQRVDRCAFAYSAIPYTVCCRMYYYLPRLFSPLLFPRKGEKGRRHSHSRPPKNSNPCCNQSIMRCRYSLSSHATCNQTFHIKYSRELPRSPAQSSKSLRTLINAPAPPSSLISFTSTSVCW